MGGMETIGSAERSSNTAEMHNQFHTISDGGYAKLLYDKFGYDRVEKELDEFLSYKFFPRFGGGIGITRLISALETIEKAEEGFAPDDETGKHRPLFRARSLAENLLVRLQLGEQNL